MSTARIINKFPNGGNSMNGVKSIEGVTKEKFSDILDEKNDNNPKSTKFIDLTDGTVNHYGTEKRYSFPSEQDLAKYAITKFAKKYSTSILNSKNFASKPTTCTIKTDINQSTNVFQDIVATIEIKQGKNKYSGMMQTYQTDYFFAVMIASKTEEGLNVIEHEYKQMLEYNNFFQGKSLRFSQEGVVFIPCPDISLKEAVLPEKVIKEYKLNVLEFLTDSKYHDITKKRALLLYGPPGGGKTTSLKAMFSHLRKKNITCLYLTDDTFKRNSLESIFDFINKYLSPCLIGFEDIDLIGEDRRHVRGIIGSLLSVLNGVEDYQKPVAIIGTTNRADILDDAVTRPCRFDRKLFIDFPNTKALRQMFKNMTGYDAPNIIQQSEEDNNKLTGAHIREICNTAQILARRNDTDVMDCIEEAFETIKESFYLASPSIGFGRCDDSDEDGICQEEAPLQENTPEREASLPMPF